MPSLDVLKNLSLDGHQVPSADSLGQSNSSEDPTNWPFPTDSVLTVEARTKVPPTYPRDSAGVMGDAMVNPSKFRKQDARIAATDIWR